MKHILMIATGGTIASKETADGLTPQLTSEELLAEVPELEQLCRIDTVQLMNRDSTNINSRDWLQMAACVREHYDAYDGFVLTHGTDTMAYTAAALSYLIQNNAKPVVITGSQKSIFNQDTDAHENLRDAFLYACDDGACGVHEEFSLEKILELKKKYPGAKVLAHPECKKTVLLAADYIGSTAALLRFASTDPADTFIVVTEAGILYQMRKENPGKTFIPAPPEDASCGCNNCAFMKMVTLDKIYRTLLDESPEVVLDEEIRRKAEGSIRRMLEIGK